MTRKETQEVVAEYLQHLNRESPFQGGLPGPDWLPGFHYWFKTQFIPFLPPGRPVVLIFDGHASELNIVTIKEAIKK